MEILKKSILTEKISALTERLNRFAFKVDPMADKFQIKAAIEKMYGVSVKSVNTIVVFGKIKSRSTKVGVVVGNIAKYKKAIVALKYGETIDLYSNV